MMFMILDVVVVKRSGVWVDGFQHGSCDCGLTTPELAICSVLAFAASSMALWNPYKGMGCAVERRSSDFCEC